mmetsp:Transcript_24540/g.39932  ORF Transcript_24540/g.39932 Transcript_24540/m.39932 type:complete len:449 (-) Transcript_24540:1004-2350(-)|eukprot:CAMPEP_0203744830 /NCGR_PEP_ID=MMETSP0098-20131031/771_1 /ASSEMBLY_ACC=CAM_ASM_000208 /TAXON_ID=96639 /ORGANISM=" , Strain NY0313808BC1" /LENGTH=448 /DNA_ID=CAMNT_0050632453 /DNA_START=2463 /DNA_END=3809 /DNA_ORIENTATION=-
MLRSICAAACVLLAHANKQIVDDNNNLVQDSSVLLQAFDWYSAGNTSGWYVYMMSIAKTVSQDFEYVWLPPPSQSVDTQGYMPGKWFNFNSNYCNKTELVGLINEFKKHNNNIHIVADVVVNHRCGSKQDHLPGVDTQCQDKWIIFEEPAWGPEMIVSYDLHRDGGPHEYYEVPNVCGPGNNDTGNNFHAAPDVDHTNEQVQKDVATYLETLKGLGFDSWRFDMAEGYAGKYVSQYLKGTWGDDYGKFSVGEYYEGSVERLQQWVNEAERNAFAFDFAFRYTLYDTINADDFSGIMSGNDLKGLIGTPTYSKRSVTFVDNHDTMEMTDRKAWQKTNPDDAKKIIQAYAISLTHPGLPSVFFDHYVDNKMQETLQGFIAFRKRMNIQTGSDVYVLKHEPGIYEVLINKDKSNEVLLRVGSKTQQLPTDEKYKIAFTGPNYTIFERKNLN